MKALTLKQIAEAVGTRTQMDKIICEGISTDTRTLQPGNLFIALKGPNFNAHDFIEIAKRNGAVAAIVSEPIATDLPHIVVENTHAALGQLASWYRRQFNFPIVALTGSYGKTTVKEMTASILRQSGEVLATQANLNNDIGVPLTLLQLQTTHHYAVLELGANYPGEIAYTTQIAQPDVALITAAAAAHLQGFGDIDGVAKVKGEIFTGLQEKGTAILNADDPHFTYWRERLPASHPVFTFATLRHAADFQGRVLHMSESGCATCVLQTPIGEIKVPLPLPGLHQITNAAAAAAASYAANAYSENPLIDTEMLQAIQRGLEKMEPIKGRLCIKTGLMGARLLDDTYNASPQAVKAALQLLKHYSGYPVAILGDMLELGESAIQYHQEIGEFAKQLQIDELYCYGELSRYTAQSFGQGAYHFNDQEQLIAKVKKILSAQVTVLIKGSRSMHMDKVVAALQKN